MRNLKKILSIALIVTMLATCAVQGLFTVSAASERVLTTETGGIFLSKYGNNVRIEGGTYDGLFLSGFDSLYETSEEVTYTFNGGNFQDVQLGSRYAGVNLSGNTILTINGGTFTSTRAVGAGLPEKSILMGDMKWFNINLQSSQVRYNNLAIIVDGSSETLDLDAIATTGRVPQRDGIWIAIVNNCTDATIPTLSGNSGNQTTLTNSADPKFIDISGLSNHDYRLYVKGGKAMPVFNGTEFLGFTLESDTTGLIPKVTYNYKDASVNANRKKVVYPTKGENGLYDLSSYTDNPMGQYGRAAAGYVTIVEFVPVAEALGASLRYKNDDTLHNGIRFGVKFLQSSVTGAGTDDANFGVILMAKSIYESKEWTLDELKASEKARVATGKTCIEGNEANAVDKTYTVNAVLYNIPEANYQSEIVAIPYIGDTLYTEQAVTRSMYSVAQACVADETASQEAKDYCQTILDSIQQ